MKILFAAGGSAGHVDPALATAEAIVDADPTAQITFLGSEQGIESKLVPASGYPLSTIEKLPFPRKLSLAVFFWPFKALGTLQRTRHVVKEFDVVVGFGGYISAFAMMAAFLERTPRIFHEANALPGLANRFAARLGALAFASYPAACTSMKGARLMSLPLRKRLTAPATSKLLAKSAFGVPEELPTLLVIGGSLGARRLNALVATLVKEGGPQEYSIIHSLGHGVELPTPTAHYRPLSYIDEMDVALSAADLVISRAGAGAVAQISRYEVPAIFIPLWHGNGEQGANAAPAVEVGAALIIKESPEMETQVRSAVSRLMCDKSERTAMRAAFTRLPHSLRSTEGANEMASAIRKSIQ
jgi:UDP-N-acetylglucosamine--N-acetylmuramyl-(pentapeptide) pyrophosphoryl-undecaprenol N-acetylglucosamine transferase